MDFELLLDSSGQEMLIYLKHISHKTIILILIIDNVRRKGGGGLIQIVEIQILSFSLINHDLCSPKMLNMTHDNTTIHDNNLINDITIL